MGKYSFVFIKLFNYIAFLAQLIKTCVSLLLFYLHTICIIIIVIVNIFDNELSLEVYVGKVPLDAKKIFN